MRMVQTMTLSLELEQQVLRLRPHHLLLCMATYKGMGYTPEFVENFNRIAGRLSSGETVMIVSGRDEICEPMHAGMRGYHCEHPGIYERDEYARQDLRKLLGRSMANGTRIAMTSQTLNQIRDAFRNGETRRACKKCSWERQCTTIAQENFRGTKVQVIPIMPDQGKWSGREDSNLRSLAPEASALPG